MLPPPYCQHASPAQGKRKQKQLPTENIAMDTQGRASAEDVTEIQRVCRSCAIESSCELDIAQLPVHGQESQSHFTAADVIDWHQD